MTHDQMAMCEEDIDMLGQTIEELLRPGGCSADNGVGDANNPRDGTSHCYGCEH